VRSKGEEQILKMCQIVGIPPDKVISEQENSGGGQYYVKGLTAELIRKIEMDATRIYDYLCFREKLWKGVDYPIQKWTSGMWAFLWNLWLFGYDVKVHKDLGFTMATDMYKTVPKKLFYHNAGVGGRKGYFNKMTYQDKLPYGLNLKLQDNASKWYYELIQEVEKNSVLIRDKGL
jgi:hypothetical protein